MTQDLYYIESGYLTPDAGYYVYTADAESLVASESLMSCDANVIAGGVVQEGSGNLSLVATMDVVISHIHGADLVAFSNAAITTEINVIKATNIALTSVFSAAIDGVRGIYVSAQADSTASIAVDNLRVRYSQAAIDAAFSLTSDISKTVDAAASANAEFTLNCDATRIAGAIYTQAEASLTAAAALEALVGKRQRFEVAAVALSSQSTSAERTRQTNAIIDSQFTVSANTNLIKSTAVSQDVNSALAVSAERTRDFTIAESSAFTPTLTVNVFKNSFAVLDSQFNLTSSISGNIIGTSSMSALASVSATVGIVKSFASSQSASTSIVLSADEYSVGRHDFIYYANTIPVETPTKFGKGSIKLAGTFSSALNQWSRVEITGPSDFSIASTDTPILSTGLQGQFGISFWYYPTNTAANHTIIDASTGSAGWFVAQTGSTIRFNLDEGVNSNTYQTSGAPLTQNEWNYVVITRKYENTTDKGRVVITVNGTVGQNSSTIYDNYSAFAYSPHLETNLIGTSGTGALAYIENLHFVNGNFIDWTQAVPTTELTTPTVNTKLLTISRYGLTLDLSGAQTESAAAIVASAGTLSATITGPQRTAAAINSQSTMAVNANKIGEINLTAFGNATVSTAAERIRSAESALTTASQLSIPGERIRTANSTQASEFTQTSTVAKTVNPIISTDAIFSELAAVARVGAGFVQLDAEAIMSVTAVKTTDSQSLIAASVSISVVAVKSITVTASIDLTTAVEANNTRIRNQVLVYVVNSQLAADAGKITQFSIDLTAVSSLACETGGILQGYADISSLASVDSAVNRIRDSSSDISSLASVTALTGNSRVVNSSAALAVESNQIATAGTVKSSSISTDAIFSELVAVAKTGQGFITLDVQATQTTQAVKTAGADATANVSVDLSATATKIQSATASLDANITAIATGTFVTTASANFISAYTLVCDVVKTANAISLEASAGTLSASATATKRAQANLSVLAFELAVGERKQTAQAALVSTSSLVARVGGTFGFRSAMTGFAAEVIVADIIHIDAKLTWVISAEDRAYSIQSDTRAYSITAEDRDYAIVNEDRQYTVTRELLTTELQGV